jgi:GH25 family lysozyme M1 (1,4-beta-N-acetylmuramidase)
MNGIDVYTGQGIIDWRTVALTQGFAMIKASQGRGETRATEHLRIFTDSKFVRNITEASKTKMKLGVWHWMTARSVAEAYYEADYFIETISPYRDKITLWAAADVESDRYLGDLGKSELTEITRAFLERIQRAGYRSMLYTNPNFLKYRFTKNAFNDTDIWLAHYGVKKPMQVPHLKIWQHSAGRVPGIGTDVDLDTGYFDSTPYSVGEKYTIRFGDLYSNGFPIPARLIGKVCTISKVKPDRILLREILSWVKI